MSSLHTNQPSTHKTSNTVHSNPSQVKQRCGHAAQTLLECAWPALASYCIAGCSTIESEDTTYVTSNSNSMLGDLCLQYMPSDTVTHRWHPQPPAGQLPDNTTTPDTLSQSPLPQIALAPLCNNPVPASHQQVVPPASVRAALCSTRQAVGMFGGPLLDQHHYGRGLLLLQHLWRSLQSNRPVPGCQHPPVKPWQQHPFAHVRPLHAERQDNRTGVHDWAHRQTAGKWASYDMGRATQTRSLQDEQTQHRHDPLLLLCCSLQCNS
jgi:hypothetical protein